MIRNTLSTPVAAFLVALVMAVAMFTSLNRAAAQGDELLLLDGKVWQQLSPDSKLAFVWGVTHVIEFERQLTNETWDTETPSFVPHFVKGMKGKTLNDVVIAVDNYYLVSTDRLGDPVMKAIVNTIVLPAL
jgi:hypothetical protein